MSKRKTKHSKKTVRKQAGKKITVSEKGMKEDILVHKIAEVPTEMPTKTLANMPVETIAETPAETPAETTAETTDKTPASDTEKPIVKEETEEEKRKKVDAILKLEKELVKDRKKLKRKNKKEKTHIPLWTKIVIVVLSLIIVAMISVAIFGYMLLSHTANVFKGNPMDILIGTELARDENNLTNILIFGTSEDAEGHDGGLLTDSILVASVDQEKKTSKIFSIPRDLWVNYTVPGGETMKDRKSVV